jgi:hypothetical protein
MSLFSRPKLLWACCLSIGIGVGVGVVWLIEEGRLATVKDSSRRSQEAAVEKVIYKMLQEDGAINEPGLSWKLFIREVNGHWLLDVVYKHSDGQGKYDIVMRAERAEIRVDLRQQAVILHMDHVKALGNNGAAGYFEDREFTVPLPSFARG